MIPQSQAQRQGDLMPKRLPLVIEAANRDTTTNKDARLVNCYIETHGQGQNAEYWIFHRPGLLDSGTGQAASTGRGVYNWRGNIYSVFGSTLYKDGISKGTVDATNGVYKFSSSVGTTPRLQLGNGVNAYNYDDAAGLVQIPTTGTTVAAGSFVVGQTYLIATVGTTDFTLIGAASNTVGLSFNATGVGAGTGTATVSGFPVTFVKGWAFLDETTYVMTSTASIQGSHLNDTRLWDPLNVLVAEIEPDGGVALGKQLVNIIAMKEWTTEVFYDAGNLTASPLGRVAGAKSIYGCVAADSVQDCDGLLMWLARSRNASPSVVLMENLKVTPISTRPVERLLDGANLSTIYSWYIKFDGHRCYGLTLKNSNLTLVYDLQERMWHQWTDSAGNYFPIVAATFDSSMRRVMQHESNGKLYYCSPIYINDDGTVVPRDIYTPNFDGGVRRRKTMNFMEVIADQQPGSVLQVRVSDDDYQTWSNFRSVNLGEARPNLIECGTFYRRAHHLRHASNTPLRLQAVEMQIDLGVL